MDALKTAGQTPLAGNQKLSEFLEDHLAVSTEPTELNARPTDRADAKAVSPADIDEANNVAGRRRFLRWFGVSASGVALANTIDTSKEKIEAGGERAQEEIARLKKAYQELDDRSRLILKLVLILSGLDFITAL
jgi:DNA-directed RNA polymerase specialized sigma subunit